MAPGGTRWFQVARSVTNICVVQSVMSLEVVSMMAQFKVVLMMAQVKAVTQQIINRACDLESSAVQGGQSLYRRLMNEGGLCD